MPDGTRRRGGAPPACGTGDNRRVSRPSHIARAAGAVALAIGLSRVLGLAREMSISHLFPPEQTDAFVAAFRVPTLLRDLLAEGALATAFVPIFARVLRVEGAARAAAVARTVLAALAVASAGLALVVVVWPGGYARLVAAGFDPGRLGTTGLLGRLMAPFLVSVALGSVLAGIANVRGRFFAPALAPALLNVGMLVGAWWLASPLGDLGWPPVSGLAVGAVLGGALQLALLTVAAGGRAALAGPLARWDDPEVRRVMLRLAPAAFAVAATYLNVILDTWLASFHGTGPVSWLFFAMRLWMLPVGVIGVGLATAQLATASRAVAAGDPGALRTALGQALRSAVLLVVPAAAGLVLLARPLVRVIYRHGAFDETAATGTALVLALYAVGLPGHVVSKLLVPTFHAIGDPWTPARLSAFAVLVKLALSAALVPLIGWPGLALATGLAALAHAALAARAIGPRVGGWRGLALGRTLIAAAVAAGGLAAVLPAAGRLLASLVPGAAWGHAAVRLGMLVALGLVLVAAIVAGTGLPEGRWLGRLTRRRPGQEGDGA
ncbi:MAG: hypothetical protein Kow0062_05400 [Acidobacteriota bacterium]